ncbi:MAG: VWA domain-containing protein [Ilumatobacter sp.]|uniref:VWA domain-containing protein n=1 Tax=Ilumatobacter sp. TaxID=1967498 RepID=UPI00391D403A
MTSRTVTSSGVARRGLRFGAVAVTAALVAAACGGASDAEPLDPADAADRLEELASDIDWVDNPITRSASIPPPSGADLANTLPPIDEFELIVDSPLPSAIEIWASTEKSGTGTDAWMTEVAEEFNRAGITLADGSPAAVDLRRIASGTGYQFIARGQELPHGFSPSNELWTAMASEFQTMTEIMPSTVSNVAGIVMKDETAEELRATYGELTPENLVDAVIAGDLVMGYTDPFASSTGLNFLLTVLSSIADGDESQLTSPDVASVFEQFQRQVPFVALTTLQMRDSVERDTGTLDTFVMEWQTYTNTDSLRDGFEFIPFGVRHDNPLHAVGELTAAQTEALELFAEFAQRSEYREKAEEFGFDPPAFTPRVEAPSGRTLIDVQNVWKDKKDGGRPVATVFVVDVSGSMEGTRILTLRNAMQSAREFIKPETKVGVVEFNDTAQKRLDIAEFDLNQQGRYAAIAEDLSPFGGTAMYDGIVLGLSMLDAERTANPDVKPILVVLTDGQTTDGLRFGDVSQMIEGLRIPVYTVGFEADLDELGRVSSLVEAASIDATEDDVEFKIAALFNAGG